MPYESPHQLESEIQELERRLEERRRALAESEQTPPEGHERELVREYVTERIGGSTNRPTGQSATQPQPTTQPIHQPVAAATDEAVEVQQLVDIAFLKGLANAIAAVNAMHNARLVDAFHDALVDHLYQDLIERGKLKPM